MSSINTITATDLFCGAGGSSTGLVAAGVDVRMAANHWPLAVQTHNTNHPFSDHDCADISQVDPRRYPSTTILWSSPSCTNHSIAKASARQQAEAIPRGSLYPPLPADAAERSRATMWDVVRFAEYHQYKAVVVENVVDAGNWVLFDAWLMAMRNLGYKHQLVFLNSMFAGVNAAPQSRDRMYVVFYKDRGRKPDLAIRPRAFCEPCQKPTNALQSFKRPNKRWGRYRAQYVYRCEHCNAVVEPTIYPASQAIDWSLPGDRIGDRTKPLADGTMRRIQAGLDKHRGGHLLIPLERNKWDGKKARPVWEPFATQTARATTGIAMTPFITTMRGGGSKTHAASVSEPLGTFSAGGNHHGLVIPDGFVMRNNGSKGNGGEHCTPLGEPLRTLTTLGHQSIVTTDQHMLVPYYGNGTATPITRPMGTQTTVDTHALVSTPTSIDDCNFRMLQPHEVQAGMAFPSEYVVLGNKRERVKQLGNAVTPPASEIIIRRVVEMLTGEAADRSLDVLA